MLDAFEKATDEPSDLLILGDFNIDYKMDESLHENQINHIENLFLLTQMINKPTRVTTSSSTCIDHLLSSIPQKHILCDVATISMSDHYMIYTCVNIIMERKQHKTRRFRDYKSFDEIDL